MTDPADELDGLVKVRVAGDDIVVPRPPFRRLTPVLRMEGLDALAELETDDQGNVKGRLDLGLIVVFGEAIAAVLWPDEAERDALLDQIMTGQQWGDFMSSAIDALNLGEAFASTGS